MRILKDSLPRLDRVSGELRKNDCFSCVWQVFTGCSAEERASLVSGLKNGISANKIIEVLTRIYPEIDWTLKEMKSRRPEKNAIQFNQAAIVFYKLSDFAMAHFSILIVNDEHQLELYDAQKKKYRLTDELDFDLFLLLNGYKHGTFDLWDTPLQNKLTYSDVVKTQNDQSKMNKQYYQIIHYIKQFNYLFQDPSMMDLDLIEFNDIGKNINSINTWVLPQQFQHVRRILNTEYIKSYSNLIRDGFTVVKIINPLRYSRKKKSKTKKNKK